MLNRLLLPLIAAVLIAGTAYADRRMREAVQVDLLPGWRTEQGTQMAALRIRLEPGWKTYWRAPGEAGIPPTFDWRGSSNVTAARIHWPVPEMMSSNGLRSIGYHGQVVLPVEFTLADPGAPARIEGEIDLGVCEEICVPMQVEVEGTLPVAGERSPDILAALVDQPVSAEEAGVREVSCALEDAESGMKLTVRIMMPPLAAQGGSETVVVEPGMPGVWASPARTQREGDTLVATGRLVPEDNGPLALDRSALRFTVLGAGRAVDIRGCGAGES